MTKKNESMKVHGLKPGMKISREKILALGWKEYDSWCDGWGVTFYYDDFRVTWYRDTEQVSYLYGVWRKN